MFRLTLACEHPSELRAALGRNGDDSEVDDEAEMIAFVSQHSSQLGPLLIS